MGAPYWRRVGTGIETRTGYLLKNIDTEFLLESIQRAARGESVMSPQIAHKLADSLRALPKDNVIVAEVNQGRISMLLSGTRQLNVRQIKALSKRFGVPPSVFLEQLGVLH